MRYLISPLSWLQELVVGAILLSTPAWLAAAPVVDEIIVVKSSDNVYFDKSVATLINHADKSLSFKVITHAYAPPGSGHVFRPVQGNKIFP